MSPGRTAADPIRFGRSARYGVALVGVVFAGYLNIATDFSAYIQASNYAGSLGTDVPLVNLVQFLTILALYIVSFAIIPTSWPRRIGAIALALIVLLVWAYIAVERGIGNLQEPAEFWYFVQDQGYITVLVALGGWVIARGRHPISWVVVLLAAVPALTSDLLDVTGASSGTYTLVVELAVGVCGIGGAWLARLIDHAVRRRRPAAAAPIAEPTPAL